MYRSANGIFICEIEVPLKLKQEDMSCKVLVRKYLFAKMQGSNIKKKLAYDQVTDWLHNKVCIYYLSG